MPTNVYFTQGTKNEQYLVEDLIIESLRIYGQEMTYIPRTLVAKDQILGEDRLSKFVNSFPIEMYFENVDSFGGQGAFIQKFGLMMEQSATLVVARRRWEQFIGRYGKTQLPNRPCEGDLIYFPLTKGLFEIKFVQHQDPFYQLGKLYVYKLQVELFQYSSEFMDTGVAEIDAFETLKTFSTNTTRNPYGAVTSVTITNGGSAYTVPPSVVFTSSSGSGAEAEAFIEDGEVVNIVMLSEGSGYRTAPLITFEGDGLDAAAVCTIEIDIDKTESFGDNNQFKSQSADIRFSESNPFGDINPGNGISVPTSPSTLSSSSDSNTIFSDSTTITADTV
jgi:hypothetical protein